jgi:hypothetical protein
MKAIESTGHKQTLAECEAAARLAIYRKLNECFCLLAVLGDKAMAERVDKLITDWTQPPTAGVAGTSEENQ